MSAAVTFDYAAWILRYPEFSAVQEPTAAEYFNEATIYWRNDGTSPCSTTAIQSMLLNMLVAHIAAIYSQSAGDQTPGAAKDASVPVGRIASATEGSVTVAFDSGAPPSEQSAFFMQTKYGFSFWRATAQYRTMRYIPGQLQAGGFPGARGLFPARGAGWRGY